MSKDLTHWVDSAGQRYADDGTKASLLLRLTEFATNHIAPPDHTFTHLPGDNLLTINGHTTGRIYEQGSDSLG
jgi:hypothetical protein